VFGPPPIRSLLRGEGGRGGKKHKKPGYGGCLTGTPPKKKRGFEKGGGRVFFRKWFPLGTGGGGGGGGGAGGTAGHGEKAILTDPALASKTF